MLNILLQLNLLGKLVQVPVDLNPDVAALSGLLQHLYVLPLAPSHHRGQKLDPGALRQGHNLVYHLVYGLFANLLAAFGTVGNPHPGVKKPHIIINLRHRPHRRARVAVGGFLVNGNSRGQPLDALHIRLLHLPQKLPGIGRQRLHISPLPLGVDGIEGQGGLARTRKARQHHQFISGDIQGNVLQIMLIGSAYLNKLL